MGKRRKAREFALQLLFQLDVTNKMSGDDSDKPMELFWEHTSCKEEIKDFSSEIIRGTLAHIEKIDENINKYAENWDLNRMPTVDRNILRFAIYEILYRDDIPLKVSINEAIEISKSYGTEDSARFINGLLDKISKTL